MKRLAVLLALAASPALAATVPFVSLHNSDFVVVLGFLSFVGLLVYFRVPGRIAGLLDGRAVQIKADLDEARALREEAKSILATYERRQKEVQEQADRIVASARDEAMAAATQAKADLQAAIARRIAAATDQIASAEAAAIRKVREDAVTIAVQAAGDLLSRQATAQGVSASIDAAIDEVGVRMH